MEFFHIIDDMFNSDWHIHSNASYDAELTLDNLLKSTKEEGIERFGLTDHANFNIPSFWENVEESKRLYEKYKQENFFFGVELTTFPKAMYDHCQKHQSRDGYYSTVPTYNYDLEFMLTEEDLDRLGVSFVVAAAHSPWHLDMNDKFKLMTEWHRQQMYIATDKRVAILGHAWWFNDASQAPWIGEDFDIIPMSMHNELASALIENDIRLEANKSMLIGSKRPQKFFDKYAEFLRYMFEKGVKITYGSDCHGPLYTTDREDVNKALSKVGFKKGDFSEPRLKI